MFSISDIRDELNHEIYLSNSRREDIKQVLLEYTQDLSLDSLIQSLSEIGSVIKALIFPEIFMVTDCCSTAESIQKLFDPVLMGSVNKNFTLTISSDEYNFFIFKTSGDMGFHTFVCVKLDGRIYLLQSYIYTYPLQIKEITDKIHLFEMRDETTYNFLFDAKEKSKGEFGMIMEYGKFEKPCERLYLLIKKYIE